MPHNIFIVEDHDWVRDMAARMLEMQPGLSICGKASSAQAAREAITDECDLILIDLGLGEEDGFSLLRDLCHRLPDVPCIVFSGQPAKDFEAAALNAGAAAYVEKGNAPALLKAIFDTLGPADD
ncbi:hypothetical protein BH23BAC4_BH23BAC4_13560 [soil metagenome]